MDAQIDAYYHQNIYSVPILIINFIIFFIFHLLWNSCSSKIKGKIEEKKISKSKNLKKFSFRKIRKETRAVWAAN
ncbi:hypothetical protein BpHYR1_003302 [Brachionus plicatilis]|uniref:Uncharacterized protein n=1 Tax=Brachionus plicatilis TaxID=10195 RepID=A0A3M7SPJ9_BRAPC|nr:hypothetical protein BpHYR1_003302 [Brachionus plicatilis]